MNKCQKCGNEFEGNFCPQCGEAYGAAGAGAMAQSCSDFLQEKRQCEVLLMLLNNCDFEPLKERALRIMDINPQNALAKMVYNCGFSILYNFDTEHPFLDFDEKPLLEYVQAHKGTIDLETSAQFAFLLICLTKKNSSAGKGLSAVFANIDRLSCSNEGKTEAYKKIVGWLCDDRFILAMQKDMKLGKVANLLGIFTDNTSSADVYRVSMQQDYVQLMVECRTTLIEITKQKIMKTDYLEDARQRLLDQLSQIGSSNGASPNAGTQTKGASFIETNQGEKKNPWGIFFSVLAVFMFILMFICFGTDTGLAVTLGVIGVGSLVFGIYFLKKR